MRIISGNLKGKKILFPKDKSTRPLRDIVKESIFNLLTHSNKFKTNFENSTVLDLFSGSGSFGFECISRGSKRVDFVENYNNAIKILNKNILLLNLKNKHKIINKDCFDYLNTATINEREYNIIFIDPPYKEQKLNVLIKKIKEIKILKKEGIIIIHRHKKDDLKISKDLKIFDIRTYGISKIILSTL